ncbi:hypothetical protein PG996_007785 [Apiospora saccharicola]|uniref:Uncharacterized protein n=1 Tax=Apiospora saccharicola TaxID=335842 RepID=A0ABR1UW36_9PEZI
MSRSCTDVLYMEHPDGTDFLSFTVTHREKGTKESRGDRYSHTLLKNLKSDAPAGLQTAKMSRGFRDLVHESWRAASQETFPADYCFAAGYFQPHSDQPAGPAPEADCEFALAILVRLRETQEPAASRLRHFLRAFRNTLRQRFEVNPSVVFPEEVWVVVSNPLNKSKNKVVESQQEEVQRQPRAAAFKKLCFLLRGSNPGALVTGGRSVANN